MKNKNSNVIIVTGKLTSGKTTLLSTLAKNLQKSWRVDGLLSFSSERKHQSSKVAESYNIHLIDEGTTLPWALHKTEGRGFNFNEETREIIDQKVATTLQEDGPEIFIIDNIGKLEIKGDGLNSIVENVLKKDFKMIIISTKKQAVKEVIEKYGIRDHTLIDLDQVSLKDATKDVVKTLHKFDGEKIGLYAAMCSFVEVGIGSVLNALHVPKKGLFLLNVQNFMLVLFGKNLRGRGLFWIIFITAGLKSFSPTGRKLKPMIYIFTQGLAFVIPSRILGWNILSAILGGILMNWVSVIISLVWKYVLFGSAAIEAYVKGFSKIATLIHLPELTFWHFVGISLVIRSILGAGVATSAFFMKSSNFLSKVQTKVEGITQIENPKEMMKLTTFRQSVTGAISDIFSKFYIIPFIFISLLIFFFADTEGLQFWAVIARGLILSWFGFLVARRINFPRIVEFLEKRDLHHVASGMTRAMGVVQTMRKNKKNSKKNKKEKNEKA